MLTSMGWIGTEFGTDICDSKSIYPYDNSDSPAFSSGTATRLTTQLYSIPVDDRS